MKELIRSHDRLARINRALLAALAEIARIAGHDYPSNDEEHDALTDCAAIAAHAITLARTGGPS